MNSVFTALCGLVNFMPPWIMLGVFGAIILLVVFIIALKGVKRKFFRVLIYILVGLIPTAYIVYLGVQAAMAAATGGNEAVLQLINFAISWGPTILFSVGVLIAVLRGMRRGLRKSLILTLHAACAGAVCIAFFFITVYVKEVDEGALKFVNWLGGENALQNMLGVPESCSTLKEALAAYIVAIPGAGFDGLSPYVYTIVDMAYRIIFGTISCLLFFFIDFILYIVYVLCYSQRKYRKNRQLEFVNGKTDKNYKKHWLGGGIVGLVRGIATGLLCISFLGSAFYVVAGGKGEGKLEEHDFGNEDVNFLYEIYRSVESYGAQGIFKILNAMTDATDTPYYLFAADLVFSGELNDEEFGISENVKFREELATLTGFARDTFDLLLKYGPDEINAIVSGEVSDGAFDTVVEIMTRSGFREEFDSLIDAFDAQTYLINLSMAFINTVVANIDEIEFTKDAIGDGEKELIKLIFKKGFLTENIPDERDLMAETGKTEAEGSDIRPYLTVNHIITKKDVKLVLNVVLSLLANEETGDTIELVKRIVPEIEKLSILSSERKAEFNPVLSRMYCLFENLYLTEEGKDGVRYSELREEDIDWIDEIHNLLAAVDDTMVLYNNMSATDGESENGEEDGEAAVSALDMVKKLFDQNDEHYKENMAAYDNVCALLIKSKVLGRALSTNFVYRTISNALLGLSPNTYIPENIVFSNTYDKDGKVVSYGETYQLLYGVKHLFSGDNAKVLDALMNSEGGASIEDVLNILAEAVEKKDDKQKTLSDYLTKSVILRSVISIELIEVEGNTFYVPESACEKVDGEFVNLITEDQLKGLLDNMSVLVDFVMPFVGDSTEWEKEIDGFLIDNDDFYDLVEKNRIFEGTVAQLFNEKLKSGGGLDVITIPAAIYDNIDGWITVDGKRGELLYLLDALRYTKFSIAGLILNSGDFKSSSVLEKITKMEEDELEAFFSSSVLHYTVSKYILDDGAKVGDDFALVVPQNSRQPLREDKIPYLIKKNELISVFGEIAKLGLDKDFTVENILVKIANDKSLLEGSKIIPASLVATIVQDDKLAEIIPAPYDVKNMGSKSELENYDSTNPWTKELPALIEALSELLGLKDAGDDFTLEDNFIDGKIGELLLQLNEEADVDRDVEEENERRTKLRVFYESVIFRSKITDEVDAVLLGENKDKDIIDGFVINRVKLDGYYRFEELQALSNAANALEITSFNDEFTVDNLKDKLNKDNLDTIYASTIVKGIMTKSIQKVIADNADICDHPLAYEENFKVYRKSEIESMLVVCGDLDGGKINLEEVSDYLYYNGETKSYILVASITNKIIDHPGIIIPDTVVEIVDGKQYIEAEELSLAVNAFLAYGLNDMEALENMTDDKAISIPDRAKRAEIFKSEIIRARITFQLIQLNKTAGGVLAVSEGNAKKVEDVRKTHSIAGGYTSVISAEQLEYLASALEILRGSEENNTEFEVPVFNKTEQILKYKDNPETFEELLKSDIVRYRICEYLNDAGRGALTLATEDAFDLTVNGMIEGVYTASPTQIMAAAEAIDKLPKF